MPHQYVPRMINLEQSDYNTVRRLAEERGLGEKGFSGALRMIIREWAELQLQDPSHMTAEDIHKVLLELGLIELSLPA